MRAKIEPLIEWLKNTNEAEADQLLKAQGTTIGYARQIAYGNKNPSGEKAVAIERATGISRKIMRPNDWSLIWPELINTDAA